MDYLIISKSENGVFSFTESSDGTETDGVIFAGSNVEIGCFNNEVRILANKEERRYVSENVFYDSQNYTDPLELIDTLKSAGFTGNFNGGGSAPKEAVYKFTGQDNTGFIDVVEESNNIGETFTLDGSEGAGKIYIPEFNANRHYIKAVFAIDSPDARFVHNPSASELDPVNFGTYQYDTLVPNAFANGGCIIFGAY